MHQYVVQKFYLWDQSHTPHPVIKCEEMDAAWEDHFYRDTEGKVFSFRLEKSGLLLRRHSEHHFTVVETLIPLWDRVGLNHR